MSWAGLMASDITDDIWAVVDPLIAKGMNDMESTDRVREAIENREAQLWVTWTGPRISAAIVTNITEFPKGRVLNICHCGGEDMASWIEHFDVLEAFGREKGCCRVKIMGRSGWERVLPGFERTAVVLEKEI